MFLCIQEDYIYILGEIVASLVEYPFKTIRHTQCSVLQVQENRCSVCSKYRNNLKSIYSKSTHQTHNHTSVKANYRYMSKQQIIHKVTSLRSNLKEKEIKIQHLQNLISADSNSYTAVDNATHSDLFTIMQSHHNEILQSYPKEVSNIYFGKPSTTWQKKTILQTGSMESSHDKVVHIFTP